MAQTLTSTARVKTSPTTFFPVSAPSNAGANVRNGHFEWADLTTSPTVTALGDGDFGAPMGYFQMLVQVKSMTAGTAETEIWIEVADNAAMSTNLRKLDVRRLPTTIASIAAPWTFQLGCPVPDGGKQYARPGIYTGGGAGAIGMDVFLDGAP